MHDNAEMSFEELKEVVSVCLDQIVQLKEENQKIQKQYKDLTEIVQMLFKGEENFVSAFETLNEELATAVLTINNGLDNIQYEMMDPKSKKREIYYPKFYPIEDTVEEIVCNRRSMARFGDGEFAIMSNVLRQKFQRLDDKLATRLTEVIKVNEEGFLVGIADNYGNLDVYNKGGKQGIRIYMTDEVRRAHERFLEKERTYHNAYISRPYALFADNNTDAPRNRFDNLKRIWNQRDVIFVEGALTRLGVGNDLFDNAKSIRRIIAPPTNSFDKYDEILRASLDFAEEDILFLIALGPSAGVLAYDLYKAGYQALDVGHIDLEYEWFLGGRGCRCEVKNKYNNEFPHGDEVEPIDDEEYFRQIIYTVVTE